MGAYDELLRSVNAQLTGGVDAAKKSLEGAYGGATREQLAASQLQARRYGTLGSDVSKAVEARIRARAGSELGSAGAKLASDAATAKANATQTIGALKIQDQTQRDIANQEMIGNIVGGVAGLLGSAAGSKVGQKIIGGWLGQPG
jgi:hypothetical protein